MPSLRPTPEGGTHSAVARSTGATGSSQAAGASAVLVSNHGGRRLDGTPAALDQLPEIAAVIGVCSHCGSVGLNRSELLGMCQDCGCPKTPLWLDSDVRR
ncbi:alpha-hydroxy-acid oxidizing protein [Pseudonocardia sp. CA-142604]|uniref:alpha-hydroxy-acid oxidizing protein n=1 Tax=Pseudonocardia sp. CA-142604 TaxID=3240024 RepID=UPI003D89FCA0